MNKHIVKPIATLFLLFNLAGIATAGQSQTLVFNGESLKLVSRNRQPTCEHWEIWFYSRAGTLKSAYPLPGEPGYRGAIWGKTSSDIQNQVQRIHKFQRAYEKVAGLPKHDDFWDRPLGPICATPSRFPPSTLVSRELQQANSNQTVFTRLWIGLGNEFTNMEPIPTGQRRQLRETMDKLSNAFEKNNKLHNLLARKNPPPDAEINDAMYEATDAVQRAYVSAEKARGMFASSVGNSACLETTFTIMNAAFKLNYQFVLVPGGVSINPANQIVSGSEIRQTSKTAATILFANIASIDPPKLDSEQSRWGFRLTGRSPFTGSPAASSANQSKSELIPAPQLSFRFDHQKDAEACYFYLVHHRQ